MRKSIALSLLLSLCSISIAAAAEQLPAVSSANIVSTMEKGLDPFRKHTIHIERLEDPLIASRPVYACHIVFVRKYQYLEEVKQKPNAKKPVGKQPVPQKKQVNAREYADIVMIPKDSVYNKDNALKLHGEETAVKGPLASVAFQKYGIQWRKGDNRYKQYTLYLGEDQHNHYFGSANLTVLMWFRRTFGLRNGFPVTKVLAEALSVKDAENFTPRYAIAELAKYRNTALKDLQEAIEDVLELDEQPYSQFLCMHFLDTPEADALLCRYAASSNPIILTALFRAFSEVNNYRLSQKRIYYRMVQSRIAPQAAMKAAEALNISKELIPYFQDYVERPYSMDDYEIGVRSIFRIRHGNVPVPHQSAASQLRDMLLRSGEVRDSMRIYNVQETQYNREDRMAKQDAERIKPYADVIINNQYKELGLLTALELSVYTPPAEDGFSKTYIRRVRRTGAQLLTNFDSRAVRTMFRNLITHVRSRQERAIFEEAYATYARLLKQADLQFKY